MGASIGHPPALLDEGFAVYASEELGADALGTLGQPNVKIKAAGRKLIATQRAMPLEKLFDFTGIGSPDSNAPVAYPQSASVVKYLVDTYGREKLRRAYRNLHASSVPSIRSANRREFARLYGKSLTQVESGWAQSVCAAPANTSFRRTSGLACGQPAATEFHSR